MVIVLDESGTHAGSPAIAVAGFVIDELNIDALEKEWSRILQEQNIDVLHMRDFVPPHGRYSHMNAEQRRKLFTSLIEAIHKYSAFGVGTAIELDDFMSTTYKNALTKVPALVNSPYEQCIRHCIIQVSEWAAETKIQNFSLFLEQGCLGGGRVQESLRSVDGTKDVLQGMRIEEIKFVTKVEFPLTQCADFLAYEMYKELDRKISVSPRATRASLIALFREKDRLATITVDALRNHLEQGAAVIEAFVNYVPPMVRFKLRCFGLRSITEEQREAVFNAMPPFRDIWNLCLATGEMGIRLDDVDPKLLPPDDPQLIFGLMEKTMYASSLHKGGRRETKSAVIGETKAPEKLESDES